jgi:hypothetical protein
LPGKAPIELIGGCRIVPCDMEDVPLAVSHVRSATLPGIDLIEIGALSRHAT